MAELPQAGPDMVATLPIAAAGTAETGATAVSAPSSPPPPPKPAPGVISSDTIKPEPAEAATPEPPPLPPSVAPNGAAPAGTSEPNT